MVLLTGCTGTGGIVLISSVVLIESLIILYLLIVKTRKKKLETALKDLISFGHAEPTGIADFDEVISGMERSMDLLKQKIQEYKDIQNEILISQSRFKVAHRLMRTGMAYSSIAHDLRGPLSGIIGSAGLLNEMTGHPKELVAKHSANILHQADICRNIIENILQQTRTEVSYMQACNISMTVRHVVDECVSLADVKEMPDLKIRDGLFGLVDCTQVWQVFQNLIVNAFEATKKEGKVWVRLIKESKRIVFSVDDDGPGIDEDTMSRIFDPLYTEKASGTGMGLVIVKMYVDANDGTIEVSRSSHGGARFVVSFPAHEPPVREQ